MKKKIAEPENDFVTLIQHGQLILNRTKDKIKEYFSENRITIFPDFDINALMEIRFNHSTLTCQFDSNNICYAGFLFFDDSESLNVYKEICNDQCEIIIPNVWKYDNYYIELKKSYDSDFYFSFCLECDSF